MSTLETLVSYMVSYIGQSPGLQLPSILLPPLSRPSIIPPRYHLDERTRRRRIR